MLRKQLYSGVCLCGHSFDRHHGMMVADPEAAKVIGSRIAGECLAFGFNENGGLDENGGTHCYGYVDKDDPDKPAWSGTRR